MGLLVKHRQSLKVVHLDFKIDQSRYEHNQETALEFLKDALAKLTPEEIDATRDFWMECPRRYSWSASVPMQIMRFACSGKGAAVNPAITEAIHVFNHNDFLREVSRILEAVKDWEDDENGEDEVKDASGIY